MPSSTDITLAASAARTTSGTGASVDLGSATTALVEVLVTAASGTSPTLVVALQTSSDGVLWQALRAANLVSTTGRTQLRAPGALRYVRAVWTIGGTSPSFTFSVAGKALVVYATPADIDALGPAALATESISDEDKDKAAIAVSTEFDDYLNARYTLPLTAWGESLKQHVVNVVAYRLLMKRGWSPVAPEDEGVRTGFTDALKWLQLVKDERISPADIVDSTPDVYDAGGFVVSKAKRGW